ncbi:MAG: septum formation initiator family protein [Lachnospiraceae bacterium]|nr:septum formation initiator family protein [Lachnospiraceae bacterium]
MARKVAYRKKRQNRLAMILVTMVVLMMLVVVAVKSVELREKKEVYDIKVAQLQTEIDAEKARTEEIEEYGKYTQTKKYVEEVAKDKLGLVYEGEIIFKDEN